MINLLPLQQKEELKQEERLKLVLILGILITLFLVCLYLVLFSIKLYLSGEVQYQKILLAEKEQEFNAPPIQILKKNLNAFNTTLVKLDSFYQDQPQLTGILEEISQTLPKEIYLTNISLNPQPNKKEIKSNLLGFSPTRSALLKFKNNLEKAGSFTNISFSQASWVKANDIDFAVSFEIK